MRRFVPLGAVAALVLAPAVYAAGFSATSPVAVSSTATTPIAGLACDGFAAQQAAGAVGYLNSEVEPHVAVDPGNSNHLVGAWQQDRWSNGGARGLVTAVSTDGGATWSVPNTDTKSSLCTGGTVANGGDFDRATDPWVAIAPDGTAYLMSLSLDNPATSADHAMLVMRSTDGGATWGNPTTLIRENNPAVLNDKNTMTADPTDSDFVYAVWDRLEFPNQRARGRAVENAFPWTGPAYFTRTTDGGATWEEPRIIFDTKGRITQTIGNQVVVVPDLDDGQHEGQLVNGFTYITLRRGGNVFGPYQVALVRSFDRGATWSRNPIIVDKIFEAATRDPDTGQAIRSAGILPDFAVDQSDGTLYAVWEDGRFSGSHAEVAFSRSTDGGVTWSTPVKVNRTVATGLNAQAFVPEVHVLADGTVGVSYYDFRNNDPNTAELETDHFLVHCHPASEDCTQPGNWQETQITDASFDLRQAPNARGLFLGDYVGLTDMGGSFLSFFGQSNSNSDPATIYASEVGP